VDAEPDQAPLKICRHCSVGSRTDADRCPSCGRPYQRRVWRWWFAVPIVALAFGIGYFGSQEIRGDDEAQPSGLTIEEAQNVPSGATAARVDGVLDGQRPDRVKRSSGGGNQLVCRLYLIVDEARTGWEFCFLDGSLEVSRPHRF
jgi:hypothetical protein